LNVSNTRPTIKFGGYQGPASVHTRAAHVFGDVIESELSNAVAFSLQENIVADGHQAADLLPMVDRGDLSLCYFSTSYLAARVPEIALLDLPFVINDRASAYPLLDGPLGQMLAEKIQENTNYKLLGFWDNGFRHFSNKSHAIHTPADCKNVRIRTLFSEMHAKVFSLMGFDPIALDVKDLLAGVQDGTVGAQENPLTNTYNFDIHKHHRYITLSGHFFGVAALLCHRPSFEQWSEDIQNAVIKAAMAATQKQRALATAEDDEILAKFNADENEIISLSDEERALFLDAVSPLIEEQRQKFGPEALALLGL